MEARNQLQNRSPNPYRELLANRHPNGMFQSGINCPQAKRTSTSRTTKERLSTYISFNRGAPAAIRLAFQICKSCTPNTKTTRMSNSLPFKRLLKGTALTLQTSSNLPPTSTSYQFHLVKVPEQVLRRSCKSIEAAERLGWY